MTNSETESDVSFPFLVQWFIGLFPVVPQRLILPHLAPTTRLSPFIISVHHWQPLQGFPQLLQLNHVWNHLSVLRVLRKNSSAFSPQRYQQKTSAKK